jgi:V8-like Glu-specific endopeptidase
MSHQVGTLQTLASPLTIGPDSGAAATSANTWVEAFAYAPAATGTKFLILHFTNVALPANNRLEVDLGYDTDVFTSADGTEIWTRPVDPKAVGGGTTVPIRYITDGAANGGVELDRYGRGERMPGEQDPNALSNCDPFLHDSTYVEPIYDPFWFCHTPPSWENSAKIPGGDIRAQVAPSVGMILTVETNEMKTTVIVCTCSVTLIGPDTVISAGHCHTPQEVLSASVIFNYATDGNGKRPAGYSGQFFKVVRDVRQHWADGSNEDYSILQLRIPPGGLGIPEVALRTDLPAVGEKVFNISHPNGAVKKVSLPHPGYATIAASSSTAIVVDPIDVSGGSSGSGLFDASGRLLGVLSNGVACNLDWFPLATVLTDIATLPDAPPVTRDVMVVFDRSGSMAADAGTGNTKMQEADHAAALFIALVRAGTGNRAGLVSFSTAATSPPDFALAAVTAAGKGTLIGPSPYTGGIVAGLAPGGSTSIGDGLEVARAQFPVPGANPRAILLLTDGLQNTPPMIADATGLLTGIDVHAIGFGTPANLDGALLSQLAEAHNGLYTRAGSPLDLKKFFALAFGNIFESGALTDPPSTLPPGQAQGAPTTFHVYDEDTVTIVVGWDRDDVELSVELKAPSGTVIPPTDPGIELEVGRGWLYLRVPLPQNGEREGLWTVTVSRIVLSDERSSAREEVQYFVSVIANGGPRLRKLRGGVRYFTGDSINPLVGLAYPEGGWPPGASVQLTVTKPTSSVGELLTQRGLSPASAVDGDTIPSRQATLAAIAQATGAPAVQYTDVVYDLYDDPSHTATFEASGVFGNELTDLFNAEGDYTFHFRASYGDAYSATRELSWTAYVDTGIDPTTTTVTTTPGAAGPGGGQTVTIVVTPRDKYGNHLGPGRGDGLTVTGTPGTTITGYPTDNGDGSYTFTGTWDPGAGQPPGVVITPPGGVPVPVSGGGGPAPGGGGPAPSGGDDDDDDGDEWWWKPLALLLAVLFAIALLTRRSRDDED